MLESGPAKLFKSRSEAENAPLAQRFFDLDGVQEIFFSRTFFTISANASEAWSVLRWLVQDAFATHLRSGAPFVLESSEPPLVFERAPEDAALLEDIQGVLDEYVLPALEQDGGSVRLVGICNGIVALEFQGACSGCPSSGATMHGHIETLLKMYIPQVMGVEMVGAAF